jgi:hypothetical protein
MTETELLDYNDVLVDFASLIQKYGFRRVLIDFQAAYPDFFEEMKTQANRLPEKPMPVLFKKKP